MLKKDALAVAQRLADKHGLINITRDMFCKEIKLNGRYLQPMFGCTFTELMSGVVPSSDAPGADAHRRAGSASIRKAQILQCAVEVAKEIGYQKLTRVNVAEKSGVHVSSVSNYFGTLLQLKSDVMRYAVKNEVLEIVAQGLGSKDRQAMKASADLKERAKCEI